GDVALPVAPRARRLYRGAANRVAGVSGGGGDRQPFPIGTAMTAPPFRKARILIVDDEDANIEILKRILTRAGFTQLATTNDSRQATASYIEHRPDLILLDLHMPH